MDVKIQIFESECLFLNLLTQGFHYEHQKTFYLKQNNIGEIGRFSFENRPNNVLCLLGDNWLDLSQVSVKRMFFSREAVLWLRRHGQGRHQLEIEMEDDTSSEHSQRPLRPKFRFVVHQVQQSTELKYISKNAAKFQWHNIYKI